MLYYQNLENIVFTKEELVDCDELVIISGYVGPNPIHKLNNSSLKSTVIYGMYGSEGIQRALHNSIVSENNASKKVNVLYSTVPVHSKCYIWKNKGKVTSVLIGSANFSDNGLTTPFREVLADATKDTFAPIEDYLKLILEKSIKCTDAVVKDNKKRQSTLLETLNDPDICRMPLYTIEKGEKVVPASSGVNWGLAKLNGSHVNIDDAYIRISVEMIDSYPHLFPKKQENPVLDAEKAKKGHRHNDHIEIIWDDGTRMTALLEGNINKELDGKRVQFPKQISTTPSKAELGKYLRKRMGFPSGYRITLEDLKKYGRCHVDVSLLGEGVYYFDFSVN